LACEFADRVVGMRQGQIVFDGLAAQLDEEILCTIYENKKPVAEIVEAPSAVRPGILWPAHT